MSTVLINELITKCDTKGRPVAADGYPISGLATIQEVELVSQMSRSHIYNMISRGELEVRRFGRSRRVTWQSVRANFL